MRPTSIREPVFGPRLEAVLARLCQKLGSLYKTQAVKLPYLVDVISAAELGHRITEATLEAWKQGVVAREAWVGVTYPPKGCLLRVERPEYDEGWTITLQGTPPERLSEEEIRVVDRVAGEYGRMSAQDLGTLTNDPIPRPRAPLTSPASPHILRFALRAARPQPGTATWDGHPRCPPAAF
jgi:uncharacterized phage-associated protein